MWLVDSQCGIVGILLNFHIWTGVKNFRPESGVKCFIHEIGVNFLSGMFNLVPPVKFLICIHFKHVSGVNQVWNRPYLMRIFCTGEYCVLDHDDLSGLKAPIYASLHQPKIITLVRCSKGNTLSPVYTMCFSTCSQHMCSQDGAFTRCVVHICFCRISHIYTCSHNERIWDFSSYFINYYGWR